MKEFIEIDEEEIDNLYIKITNNVKKLRKEKKVTQEQLALAIGHTSASMISKIEANLENKHYSIRQLYLISKVLNIPFEKLFQFEQ